MLVVPGDGIGDEPLGTKDKFWVRNPVTREPWLFKFARVTGGRQMGEDWAEWIVHHIASHIGLPSAVVLPATCESRRGIVSKDVGDSLAGQRLVHGNSLLGVSDPSYDGTLGRTNPGYTPAAVAAALKGVDPPIGWGTPRLSGFSVWSGYLVLDALVAGRDRHHENWGAIRDGRRLHLAPSYDHGNALGFQEPESRAAELAASPERLASWLARGKSHHFAGRPTLVALAIEALKLAGEEAQLYWAGRIDELDHGEVRAMLDAVPPQIMSEAARTLALNIVIENRRRLIDAFDSL